MKIFISHATEDKDKVARPLAKALQEYGYEIWYDEYSLKLGDSLTAEIDRGLIECDYGVVILSKSFFSKKWTQKELAGLVARETSPSTGKTIILPVWHEINAEEIKQYSLTLADRIAVSTSSGLKKVVDEIVKVVDGHARTSLYQNEQASTEAKRFREEATVTSAPPIDLFRTIDSGSSIIALSPDGANLFLKFAGGGIEMWDTATGQLKDKVVWKDRMIESMICLGNSEIIATSVPERNANLWDFLSLPRLTSVLRLWHTSNGGFSFGGDLTILGGSPTMGCKAILTERESVICISRKVNSSIKHPFDEGSVELYTNIISLHRCNFDTRQKVSFSKIRTMESITHRNFDAEASSCAISPNGKLHVFSLPDETILRGEQFTVSLLKKQCHSLMFSPDSHFVIGGAERRIWIWNSQSGQPEQIIDAEEPAISPDGKLLANITSEGDIRLLRTADWTVITELKQPTGRARRIVFSRTGKLMASTDYGKTYLWRLHI